MSLLTNKTWRGSTLTDWNVLIILLPCKKTWEHSLKTRLGRISTLICGQSTHLPYKAAVIVVPDWHWILSHWRENSGNILVPGFLNPSMSVTQGQNQTYTSNQLMSWRLSKGAITPRTHPCDMHYLSFPWHIFSCTQKTPGHLSGEGIFSYWMRRETLCCLTNCV